MKHAQHKLATVVALTCLISLASASSAFAQDTPDKLIKYTPKNTGFLLGVDVKATKKTTVGKEILKEIAADTGMQKDLKKIEKFAKFKVERDLYSVVMASPTPTGNGKSIGRTFVLVLSGKFDKKHLDGLMAKEKSKRTIGAYTVFSPESNVDIALVNNTTMVITQGAEAYRKSAWQTVIGKAASAAKHKGLSKMIRSTNTKKPIFILANARKLKQPKGPQVNSGIFEIGLKSGLDIKMRLRMKDEANAKQALADLEKSMPSGKAMLSMVKGDKLIDNLKMKQKGALITLTTSMNNKNLKATIEAIRAQQKAKKK